MIKRLITPGKSSNCYLVSCDITKKTVIIDPGTGSDIILSKIKELDLEASLIVLTHGHHDHIGAVENLRKELKINVAIHKNDAEKLTDPIKNRSLYHGANVILTPAEIVLKDNQKLKVGDMEIIVLHTPGHTPGGICLLTEQGLFSGDTLFYETIGRADLPGGNLQDLINGIKDKLMDLEDEVQVYPGHGDSTSIGQERRINPYIQ